MLRSYYVVRNVLMAVVLVVTGMAFFAGPASAHQGNIVVQSKECVNADTVRVTYKVSWSAVPQAAWNTKVYSRTGTTAFNAAWDDTPQAAASWATTDRGAVGAASGSRTWTVELKKSQFSGSNGPWEYAFFPWTNGNTGSRYHDTRVEGMDWSSCSPKQATVNASFTDQRCDGKTYVAPSMDAPTFTGTQRSISGNAAPGQTVTVTYTANPGWAITGQSSFTHTFPTEPSSATYCDQPQGKTVKQTETGCDLTGFGDFEPGTITRTGVRDYVWTGSKWQLEPESDIAWSEWTQAAGDVYSDTQYKNKCAPAKPEPKTVSDVKDGCDLSYWGDFEAGVIRRTGVQEYVWNTSGRAWELESASGIAWSAWTQAAGDVYTDTEYKDECAPAKPEPKTVTDSTDGCDLSSWGDFEAGVIRRTGVQEHVWNTETRAWELEPASGIAWSDWTQAAGDVWGDEVYFEECAPQQPSPLSVKDKETSCDLSGYGDFEAGVIRRTGVQEQVWNTQTRAWELEPASEISWNPWTQADEDVWTDGEYFYHCAPEQPAPKPLHQEEPGCDLSGYGDFEAGVIGREGQQAYVWNGGTREWELGQVAWSDWEQTSTYSDEEYQELCATEQPQPEVVSDTATGCDLSEYGDFEAGVIGREGERPYVWDLEDRTWVLGDTVWGEWTQTSTYSDEEYQELCATEQLQPEVVSDTATGCDLSEYGDFEAGVIGREGERPYVWDLEDRTWVLGDTVWGEWTQTSAYSDEEYQELCATEQPQPEVVSDTATGCDLSEYGDFEAGVIGREGERPYVWDLEDRTWVLGDTVWGEWTQTSTYSDEEYQELCADEQPEPVVREVSGTDASCELGGVTTWVDTYTTPFVWNPDSRTWELGEETGPVRTSEEFVRYTPAEYEDECAEVKGEEETDDDEEEPGKPGIEVKGEQGQVPSEVPTEVAAGENGAAGPLGAVQRNPLWLLVVGGGVALLGLAGSRRRRMADR